MHRASWREAYGPHVGPATLEAALGDAAPWVTAWEQQIALGPPRTLAVAGEEIVGFAVAGPSRDPASPEPNELYALYVRQAWWGTGLGDALIAAALPPGPCWLHVLDANARARAFYRRHGFEADGQRHFYTGLDAWELRMSRR